MRWRRLCVFLALGALSFVVVGCLQRAPTPAVPEPEPTPVASPTSVMPTPTLLPRDHTPLPDSGVVHGMLLVDDEPAVERVMYLASVINTGGDGMGVAELDPVTAPRAESDASGYFVFLDVAPGQYALGINSPIGAVLIRGVDGQEIIAEVQAGETLDLGTVQIVPFT